MTRSSEELFEQMFALHHRALVSLLAVSGFEEWSAHEVLAMRLFEKHPHALNASSIAYGLGISVGHASRIATRLRKRGLVSEFRWRQTRSLSLTSAGREWLRREQPYFSEFAEEVFRGLSASERESLARILQRIRGNVGRQ